MTSLEAQQDVMDVMDRIENAKVAMGNTLANLIRSRINEGKAEKSVIENDVKNVVGKLEVSMQNDVLKYALIALASTSSTRNNKPQQKRNPYKGLFEY